MVVESGVSTSDLCLSVVWEWSVTVIYVSLSVCVVFRAAAAIGGSTRGEIGGSTRGGDRWLHHCVRVCLWKRSVSQVLYVCVSLSLCVVCGGGSSGPCLHDCVRGIEVGVRCVCV